MIGRVSDRATFSELAAAPVVRRGPVRVRFVPTLPIVPDDRDGSAVARVAFAIGKPVGNAVTRNRVRRRLRAALVDVDRARQQGLPAGAYLIGADRSVAVLPYTDLVQTVASAVDIADDRARSAQVGRS